VSLVLTVALNIFVHLFPGHARRAMDWLDDPGAQRAAEQSASRSRVRVVVPWKAMIVVSIVLTAAINVLLWAK
jgi:hypothetical protein